MRNSLILLLLCFNFSGCSKNEGATTAMPSSASERTVNDTNRFMAYEHAIALGVEENLVTPLYQSVETECLQTAKEACVILESHLISGYHISAYLKIRAKPAVIKKLLASLATQGNVISQSVKAEDLAAPINDADKKLEMLKDYRSKLITLRTKANADIEAMIKVSKELATTQSEIESLSGERAHLLHRIETELLNISISSKVEASFWRPIVNALGNFSTNLSQGISTAVTVVAYLIPWVLVLSLCWWVARKLWIRNKIKTSS